MTQTNSTLKAIRECLAKTPLFHLTYDNVTFPLTMLGWELGEEINPVMYSAK